MEHIKSRCRKVFGLEPHQCGDTMYTNVVELKGKTELTTKTH